MWDLWRILTSDGRPQIAVTLNGVEKTLLFTTTSVINDSQVVTFTEPGVKVKMRNYGIALKRPFCLYGVGSRGIYNFRMTRELLTLYFIVNMMEENVQNGKDFLNMRTMSEGS